ncbi:MAG: hypothetical protein AB1492_08340 [Bacillota bacterium]
MRKWISLLTLLLLAAAVPAHATTGTYYYYGGIRDTRTSSTTAGYHMGDVHGINNADVGILTIIYQKYKQEITTTKTSSRTGEVRFGAQVRNDALGVLNAQLGGHYTNATTWTIGTIKGGTFEVHPRTRATLSAYLGQGTTQGTEVVRVEYYPGAGDPVFVQGVDDPSLSQSDADLATVQSFPVISYQYNSFSAVYPSASEFILISQSWPLP